MKTNNGITYQDILDVRQLMQNYNIPKPSQSELAFDEAVRTEMYFALNKNMLYKTIRESNKIFYVYNYVFEAMKRDNFDCLDKLDVVNKPIPNNYFIDLELKEENVDD